MHFVDLVSLKTIMKTTLIILSVLLCSACKETEITRKPLANQLVGTTWFTHRGTGVYDGLEYIRVLKFSSESELYFMDYNSSGLILNAPDKYRFTRNVNSIEAVNEFQKLKGFKDENVIKIGPYDYYYIDLNGSVSEYLKKHKL